MQALRGLHYKLCLMGVSVTGPGFIYGDNKSQLTNSSIPELILKKKTHPICYHTIQELVAMCESCVTHFGTGENISDPLTKCTLIFGNVLYDLYDDFPQQY